jgi:hypothetical protein
MKLSSVSWNVLLIRSDALPGPSAVGVPVAVVLGSVSKVFTAEIFSLTLNKRSGIIISDE